MKSKRAEIIGYICCLIAGLLLTIFNKQANLFDWIIILLGIMFVIPSLVSLIMLSIPPKDPQVKPNRFMIMPSAAGLALGILMICIPATFTHLLTWLFAIILIVFGIFQIVVEMLNHRDYQTGVYTLIVPTLITVAGIVIICIGPSKIQDIAAIITGIALLLYGLNGIAGCVLLSKKMRQEKGDKRQEKGDKRQENGDRRPEIGEESKAAKKDNKYVAE